MRKKSAQKPPQSSLRTFKLFLIIVSFFILISLFFKLFLAVRSSKYDSSHRFTIGVLRQDRSLSEVVSFDPVMKSMVTLSVEGREPGLSPEQIMGVGFDGTIIALQREDTKTLLTDALLHRSHVKSTVSGIDLVRLWLFANGLPQTSRLSRTLNLPLDGGEIDKLSASLFADSALSDNNASIQIINGTTEPGFGQRLERMLSNMGANVVVVSTAPTPITQTTLVYFGPETETVKRLGQLLDLIPEKGGMKKIADIVITLGESSSDTLEF